MGVVFASSSRVTCPTTSIIGAYIRKNFRQNRDPSNQLQLLFAGNVEVKLMIDDV